MAKLKLQISEEDMPDRIAIYSTLEGYRLMYLMNKELNTYFTKLTDKKDLSAYKSSISENSFFEVYRWKDEMCLCDWICVKNKVVSSKEIVNSALFQITSSVDYWDKSYAKADFILELGESDYSLSDVEALCLQLEKLPEVLSAQII